MGKSHACIDPKHHVHDAAGVVAAVEAACRERGLRLTPIRARVLGLIADAGQPAKAYDLLEQLRNDRDADGEGSGAAMRRRGVRSCAWCLPTPRVISGRLPRSRSPPQPNRAIRRPPRAV